MSTSRRSRARSLALAAVGAVVPLALAHAGDCVDYTAHDYRLGSIHVGRPRDVALRGTVAFTAGTNGFAYAVDISNPLAPAILDSVAIDGTTNRLIRSGSYLFLAQQSPDQLVAIDAGNPADLVVADELILAGAPTHVAVNGRYAYVVTLDGTLHVVDILDPANLAWRQGIPVAAAGRAVAVVDSYAYVAASSFGVYVLDATSPGQLVTTPVVVVPIHANDLAVAGTHVLVASTDALRVIDVFNPDRPILVDDAIDVEAKYVAVSGTRAFVATWRNGIGHFYLVDVSALPTLRVMGVFGSAYMNYGIDVRSGLGLVTGGSELRLLDLGRSPAPLVSDFRPTDLGAVELDTSHAYHGSGARLRIRSTADWSQTGSVLAPLFDAMTVADGYVYGASLDELWIVDVRNPASPSIAASLAFSGNVTVRDVAVAGDRAYVAVDERVTGNTFWTTLVAVDISDRTSPIIAGSSDGSPSSTGSRQVEIVGGHAIVQFAAWADVYGLGNPGAPVRIGELLALRDRNVLAVAGTTLFSARPGLVDVFDASDPTAPAHLAAFPVPFGLSTMRASDGYLAAGNAAGFVQLFDTGDPASPAFLGYLLVESAVERLAVSPSHVLAGGVRPGPGGPAVLAAALAPCLDIVPVLLSRFEVWRDGETVRIEWTASGRDDDYRLIAHRQGDTYVVPHVALGRGRYRAEDAAPGPGMTITYVLHGREDDGRWELLAERALLPGPGPRDHAGAHPNPFTTRATITLDGTGPSGLRAGVFDTGGRLVRSLAPAALDPVRVTWDGRDARGRMLPAGLYVIRLLGSDRAGQGVKIQLVR